MKFYELNNGDLLQATMPIWGKKGIELTIGDKFLIKDLWTDFGLPYELPYHALVVLADGREAMIEHGDLLLRTKLL